MNYYLHTKHIINTSKCYYKFEVHFFAGYITAFSNTNLITTQQTTKLDKLLTDKYYKEKKGE